MTGRTEELGDVAVWTSGGTPPRGLSEYWSGTIPWISAATLRESHIYTSTQFLTASGVEKGSNIAPTGSTLILVRGMALHHELRVGIATRDVAFNQDVKALIPRPFVEPEFLTYAILGKAPEILSLVSSAGSGTGVLNSDRLKRIQIWLPSRDEQIRVVSRINDLDVLVGSLATTIAKRRAIKQGMMQELLTGRTRLPGFSGDWEEATLGSVLHVKNGRSQWNVEVPNGRYPIFATGGEIGRTDTPIYSGPSVLIGRKGTIDRPRYQETPFWTVDTLFYTEIEARCDGRFLYYLCTTIDWMALNEATGVPSLTGSRIESVKVRIPTGDEQRAIAQVLRDTDAEIEALEKRLEATRQIKEGMMQELLTGRTRLV